MTTDTTRSSGHETIEVRKVWRQFPGADGAVTAVQDVDLSANKHEVVALIGPTGCGKTTLLNLVAGFDRPTRGQVIVNGEEVAGPGPDRGVVFQNYGLYPWLSIEDNMAFGAIYQSGGKTGRSAHRKAVRERVSYYLKQLGLESARARYPYQISGGMQARTALGRVLVASPTVLLLDEPFSSVDALTRASLHKLVLGLLSAEENEDKSVILITHDIDEAIVLADKIYIMSPPPGRVVAEIRVPFSRHRDYESVVQDEAVVEVRRQVLAHLRVE